jgi:D-alanyl-D-alanine carboxypeptidase
MSGVKRISCPNVQCLPPARGLFQAKSLIPQKTTFFMTRLLPWLYVAVMIAETVARSEQAFVARMNEEAQRLGMTRTNFTNVNGLPDERQVSTARDLAKLARAIIVEFPEHAGLFSSIQVKVGKKTMRTHNSLLVSLPGADGMKTGFICESGFNVVASATRDGRKIVAVVLGEPSTALRNARATDLLEKGFRRHFWKSLFGSSLDGLAMQASSSDSPTHLSESVCGGARAKSTVRPSIKSKVVRTRSPG